MTSSVLKIAPLGFPWQTLDPFLFCVHHLDAYPAGDEHMRPRASLNGRAIGADFSGKDGWSMYHGEGVPGFPQHPHRGFETITIARSGFIDHSDSLGAAARFGAGDVQWMTAGKGIVHSEMFPLVHADADNPTELFQIWLNLPAKNKMAEPYFSMYWNENIPRVVTRDANQLATEVTVFAGEYTGDDAGAVGVTPPPDSWAADPRAGLKILTIHLRDSGARFVLPADEPGINRTLYLFEGKGVRIDGQALPAKHLAAVRFDANLTIEAGAEPCELLLLQARPIGEPVAQHGPFVMNTSAEIEAAFRDYQMTRFGGWPWPSDDPVHDRQAERFARHADGRTESPPATRVAV